MKENQKFYKVLYLILAIIGSILAVISTIFDYMISSYVCVFCVCISLFGLENTK